MSKNFFPLLEIFSPPDWLLIMLPGMSCGIKEKQERKSD